MCNVIPCFASVFHDDGSSTVPALGNVLLSRAGSKFCVSPNLVRYQDETSCIVYTKFPCLFIYVRGIKMSSVGVVETYLYENLTETSCLGVIYTCSM